MNVIICDYKYYINIIHKQKQAINFSQIKMFLNIVFNCNSQEKSKTIINITYMGAFNV